MYTSVHLDVAQGSGATSNKHDALIEAQILWFSVGYNCYLTLYMVESKP